MLLGAKYQPNVSIFIDFLVIENPQNDDNSINEKLNFCKRYGIPIINSKDAFEDDYSLFIKNVKYDAKQLKPNSMFFGKVFFLDPKLPKEIFNKLRRMIIENEGTRISALTDEIDYLLTIDFAKYIGHHDKLFHYQYVFDCAESSALLFAEFYKVNLPVERTVLKDVVAVVDGTLGIAYVNKLRSLGAVVRASIDMRVTHFISDKNGSKNKNQQYKTISPAWVDQCLSTLKFVKETKFMSGGPVLSLKKRLDSQKVPKEMVFQFTGLPSFLKKEAINKFKEFGIRYSESNDYEDCTHLIMGQLNSSEKFFYSLVNGCWILRPDFIENFANQANFDFSRFEWSVSHTSDKENKMNLSDKEIKHIEAIRRWRIRIQEGGKKPFHKWSIKLYSPENKISSYTKLIEYGGGRVTQQDDYTRVFVDKNYRGEVKEKDSLSADYLFSYLFK